MALGRLEHVSVDIASWNLIRTHLIIAKHGSLLSRRLANLLLQKGPQLLIVKILNIIRIIKSWAPRRGRYLGVLLR